ncbi:ribosylnicotinamide kinase [Friedmanniomyces endolithicus]|uniref:Ribosylnicotinamide kinase n=1 Tax=Friedmanniomyces endolithicus TaxID=329885 RepID=A0AAN6HAT6_9PEZI|nr:ribosylnicotinamide kinase [Friedmanniomyces endolithicus]KAK0776140.1 ribosylnicotinamide kinase [Friedmanniomyces endolithicus]KAK0791095.1 ribosylnicotinamide kinase [Friedmanniomyces endolithicus]KAK0799173.1 ribosylnicotinamide kinase [Friedmanniomyces endolithicus]KAK0837301.1 ribosylnicotinamide kinase [Friedmanniomyces endolithicus]
MPEPTNAILVGISGPSSSGKTTLARLLREIFTNVFILHLDDFYNTDADIPVNAAGIADWDCLDSINLPALQQALEHIRANGTSPKDFVSKEDKNSVGKVDVDESELEDLRWKASRWMFQDVPPIAIIDGFLLYTDEMKSIRDLFDVKIFLRTDYETAKRRREARSGYVTLEGFWKDPPGYVDKVVWPNYVKDHAFLFKEGNVEGDLDETRLQHLGIRGMPSNAQENMTACMHWAYGVIEEALEKRIAR